MKVEVLLAYYGDKYNTDVLIMDRNGNTIYEWDSGINYDWYYGRIDLLFKMPKQIRKMKVRTFTTFQVGNSAIHMCLAIITE